MLAFMLAFAGATGGAGAVVDSTVVVLTSGIALSIY
jgi:hypothetical protein